MVLVDTSAWIHALRPDGDPGTRGRVDELLRAGNACWCAMVRLELWGGARGRHEKNVLREMERILPELSIDTAVWDGACAMAASLGEKGRTAPAADLLIAACARHHGVQILHDDRHFAVLPPGPPGRRGGRLRPARRRPSDPEGILPPNTLA